MLIQALGVVLSFQTQWLNPNPCTIANMVISYITTLLLYYKYTHNSTFQLHIKTNKHTTNKQTQNNNNMTPPSTHNATATATGFRWNSPIPYLFGGLALMLTLIACALIILVCSYKKPYSSSSSNSSESGDQEKASVPEFRVELSPQMEPKIVILMPGDVNPTYLAKPATHTCVEDCNKPAPVTDTD